MITFTIISHVVHKRNSIGGVGGYAPYIREMNLWLKYVDRVVVVAPIVEAEFGPIDIAYEHDNIVFMAVPSFNLTSGREIVRSILYLPTILASIYRGMRMADHIHLRCPGNMGLLGCLVQTLFRSKPKSAKYAGNWDWDSRQPLTYRWQQHLLQNRLVTRNMTAMVYGQWPGMTENTKSVFTATYSQAEIVETPIRQLQGRVELLFVGTISPNKRPLLCVQAVKILADRGVDVRLTLLGEGRQRQQIAEYCRQNGIEHQVILRGNVDKSEVKRYMQQSHFIVFASQSEGWPKAIAESMFWGCLPITTRVSCVSQMLAEGSRGRLIEPTAAQMVEAIEYYLSHEDQYREQAQAAMDWSRQYTVERFEALIKSFIIPTI